MKMLLALAVLTLAACGQDSRTIHAWRTAPETMRILVREDVVPPFAASIGGEHHRRLVIDLDVPAGGTGLVPVERMRIDDQPGTYVWQPPTGDVGGEEVRVIVLDPHAADASGIWRTTPTRFAGWVHVRPDRKLEIRLAEPDRGTQPCWFNGLHRVAAAPPR